MTNTTVGIAAMTVPDQPPRPCSSWVRYTSRSPGAAGSSGSVQASRLEPTGSAVVRSGRVELGHPGSRSVYRGL